MHDENSGKGEKQAVFSPKFETGGNYEVRVSYSAGGNRASNVVVTVDHQDGKSRFLINQSKKPTINDLFHSVGTFRFEADNVASVTISNEGTDGHVIVDAVQFLKRVSDIAVADQDAGPRSEALPKARLAKVDDSTDDVKKSAKVVALEKRINDLDRSLKEIKKNPVRPVAVAMSVKDSPTPKDGHLHIRGSVRNLGPVIPRGFLSVCSDDPRPDFDPSDEWAIATGGMDCESQSSADGESLCESSLETSIWKGVGSHHRQFWLCGDKNHRIPNCLIFWPQILLIPIGRRKN